MKSAETTVDKWVGCPPSPGWQFEPQLLHSSCEQRMCVHNLYLVPSLNHLNKVFEKLHKYDSTTVMPIVYVKIVEDQYDNISTIAGMFSQFKNLKITAQ